MKDVAPLRYGVIFKKAFCVPDIFNAFVSDVLNVPFQIDHVETEKSFSPSIGKIDTYFDLFAEDTAHRVIVDIQHIRYPDHYHRFLYYHCVAMMEMISSSHNYQPTMKVFTIVVLTSGDKHKKDIGVTSFDPVDLEGHPYHEISHKIVHICPKYVTEKTPEPYREWMRAIDDTLDERVDESQYTRPEIQHLFSLIEKDVITPQEYAAMKEEYGQQQVFQEKYEQGMKDTVLKFLNMGLLTVEQIAQATGFSVEDIKDFSLENES